MLYLFIGVFLYGLTHPVGALFLRENKAPLLFSVIYIGMRCLLQIPLILTQIQKYKFTQTHLGIFLLSGLVGAFLHWSEFQALTTSIPIGQITFITYCFPLWIFLFTLLSGAKIRPKDILRFILAIFGLYLIIPTESGFDVIHNNYIYPLISSVLLAMWILISKRSQNKSIPPIVFSFFYDLSSFIFLVFLALTYGQYQVNDLAHFAQNNISWGLILFCLTVGIIPNLLNFTGLSKVTSLNASLIMMFEPVIASLIASLMYHEHMSIMFFLGGSLILLANVPEEVLRFKFKKS